MHGDTPDRTEILFLALCRPALKAGVPIEGLLLNGAISFLGGMEFSGPSLWRSPFMFWAVMFVPTHYLMRRITAWDYHGFRTIRLWLLTYGVGRLRLAALPRQRPKSAKGIPSSG